MKIEIMEVDKERGIARVTTPNSRYYARQISVDGTAENKRWDYVPSVTWITEIGWPKGPGFFRYLANKASWEEAEEIRIAAGEKGSKVHQGVRRLIEGGTVGMGDSFENPNTLKAEELTRDEYHCLMTFNQWCDEEEPEFLANEYTVWNERHNYAGTLDIKCRLKSTKYRKIHIVDVKTSIHIFTPMELQVSAYKHADTTLPKSGVRLGILQLGYRLNKKKKFKYTEVPDRFPLFLAAKRIWAHETAGQKPLERTFPLEIQLRNLRAVASNPTMPVLGHAQEDEAVIRHGRAIYRDDGSLFSTGEPGQ